MLTLEQILSTLEETGEMPSTEYLAPTILALLECWNLSVVALNALVEDSPSKDYFVTLAAVETKAVMSSDVLKKSNTVH